MTETWRWRRVVDGVWLTVFFHVTDGVIQDPKNTHWCHWFEGWVGKNINDLLSDYAATEAGGTVRLSKVSHALEQK